MDRTQLIVTITATLAVCMALAAAIVCIASGVAERRAEKEEE